MFAFAWVGPGTLLAAGDLDDQRAIEVLALEPLEPDEEVGDVGVRTPLVDVRDREAEVVVLHERRDVAVMFEDLGEQLLPGVADLAVEGDVGDFGLLDGDDRLARVEERRRRSTRAG